MSSGEPVHVREDREKLRRLRIVALGAYPLTSACAKELERTRVEPTTDGPQKHAA